MAGSRNWMKPPALVANQWILAPEKALTLSNCYSFGFWILLNPTKVIQHKIFDKILMSDALQIIFFLLFR